MWEKRAWLLHVVLHLHVLPYFGRALTKVPTSASFLHTQCENERLTYHSLISSLLAKHQSDGLLVTEIFNLHGWEGQPQVIIVNGSLISMTEPHLNAKGHLMPLLTSISQKVRLPDLVLAADIMDQPEDDISRHGGPWFGYCNMMFQTTNILYPAGGPVEKRLSCGGKCVPFTRKDRRESRAVFLGSSTGWLTGRRTAVVLAGILHPDHVYSGYTALIDIGQDIRNSNHPTFDSIKPQMNLAEQIKKFRYIVNVDGHCAALRMRDLLASDSVVLWVESNEVEWYHSLLQPFVHYIPIRFFPHDSEDPLRDIVTKINWANDHPAEMAKILQNDHLFADQHFTEHAMTCYSVQLLHEYAALFSDQWRLQNLASEGFFAQSVFHVRSEHGPKILQPV